VDANLVLLSNPLISIIIPVYNAQGFLQQCLTSIQVQTFEEWECICVDDGSSDDSARIIQKIIEDDSRFRLIRQDNGGPGAARNTGLCAANGKYFTFVDSDDLIHHEMVESLLSLAQRHNADLVVCGFFRFEFESEFYSKIQNSSFKDSETDIQYSPLLPKMVDWRKFRVHPVGKLYLHEKHGNIKFPNNYGAEDDYVSFDVYGQSTKVVFTKTQYYGYRIIETSLTKSITKYRSYISGDIEAAIHCEELCRNNSVSEMTTKQLFMTNIMRIFFNINEMSVDTRLQKVDKKELMQVANKGLQKIKRQFSGLYRIVPPVHYISYIAIRLRALWLLISWQWLKVNILKKSISMVRTALS
jgi:glycosyltransferase involved in cell wall biosynthesis